MHCLVPEPDPAWQADCSKNEQAWGLLLSQHAKRLCLCKQVPSFSVSLMFTVINYVLSDHISDNLSAIDI